jgi:hypothetical protein
MISEESFYDKIQEMSEMNEATSVVLPEDDVIWQSLAVQFEDNKGIDGVYIFIYVFICVYVCVYMYVCLYLCIYVHTCMWFY